MTSCLLNYFIEDKQLKSTCDFNPFRIEEDVVIYEVVKVVRQIPLFLEDHLERFQHSLALAGIPGISLNFIKNSLLQLIAANQLKSGNIRFQISKANTNRAHWFCWVSPHFYPTEKQHTNGIDIGLIEHIRKNPEIKQWDKDFKQNTEKYLNTTGYYEALLINEQGLITEGSRSNVFFIKNESVTTSPTNAALSGITRKKVIELIKDLGVKLSEKLTSLDEMYNADAIFLTGTSPGVLAVSSVNGRAIPSNQNKLLNEIKSNYDRLCQRYIDQFV